MAEINSFLHIFAIISVVGAIVSFIIRVSIQALVLKYFIKKYEIPQEYGKAWLAIFIPSLVVSILAIPLVLAELPNFLLVVLWLLFFPILIFSIKLVYKTDTRTSTSISLKFFLVIAALIIVVAGGQTILGIVTVNPLNADVPQSVCTTDCEFAFRTDLGYSGGPLTVTGYNIPTGKFQERENYILTKKTYSEDELSNMERGVRDKIIGKLSAKNCNYMEFGSSGGQCKGTSKNIFDNLKNILI